MYSKNGFTLLEVLLSFGIVIVLSLVFFLSGGVSRKNTTLQNTLEILRAVMSATQSKARAQEENSVWGVKFMNSAASSSYDIFKGSLWTSGNVVRHQSLDPSLLFSEPSSFSQKFETYFKGTSGIPREAKTITITPKIYTGYIGDLILSLSGKIATRLEQGLVGYWHLDEGSEGAVFDASGANNNGAIVGTQTWQSSQNCKSGSCVSFNGSTDYIQIPNSSLLNPISAVSFGGWFYARDLGAITGSYISKRDSFILYPNSDKSMRAYIYNSNDGTRSYASSTPNMISLNTWQYWMATYDGSHIKLYLNGSLINSVAFNGVLGTSGDLYIGADVGCGGCDERFLNGLADEIRIYNRALSDQEIMDRYNDFRM